MNIKIDMCHKVKYILNTLHKQGFEAHIVGGCVRDSIIGRKVNDWDITTNALPEMIMKVFCNERTIPTGIKHGTITVMVDDQGFEITTYRTEGKYTDFRRPDEVKFTQKIEEDLKRRDFTINAMAYNDGSGLIDLFGGMDDIKNKLIRCVGNPDERFKEDALRMMRAVRFAAELGFHIEEGTLNAICRNSGLLDRISKERIRDELNKIILSNNPWRVKTLTDTGLMKHIFKDMTDSYQWNDMIKCLSNMENMLYLKLAVVFLFLNNCKRSRWDMAHDFLRALKYDNETIKRVTELVKNYDSSIEDDKKSIKRWLNNIGVQRFKDLIKLREVCGNDDLEEIKRLTDEIIQNHECFAIKDLYVNGRDLLDIGFNGREIGDTLRKLLDMVIEGDIPNDREKLKDECQKLYENIKK